MSKQVRWLYRELERWLDSGLIEREQAEAISALYPPPGEARPWALILFSGMGAVIVGLGIILLFAYNWAAMPKFAKLATIFVGLGAAHCGGIWLHAKSERFRPVGEALTILGTMLFGAGIWLVAQIYHIDEHFPTAFLVWGLGALALAWALPSVAQGILAAVLLAIWVGVEAGEFGVAMHVGPVLIVVLLGALAYRQRSRVLLGVVIASFAVALLFSGMAVGDEELVTSLLLCVAAVSMAAGVLVRRHGRFPEAGPIFGFLGLSTYFVMLFLLCFPDVADWMLDPPFGEAAAGVYWLVLLAAALAAWAAVAWPLGPWRGDRRRRDCPADLLLIPLTLIFSQCYAIFLHGFDDWAVAAPFNLVLLAHAAAMMRRGCREGRLRPTVLGSLLFAALAMARYFDLFESLIARGVVFVVVGGVLFAEGVLYARSKQAPAEEQAL